MHVIGMFHLSRDGARCQRSSSTASSKQREGHGCLMRLGPIAAHADINAERDVERHHPFHALADQGL